MPLLTNDYFKYADVEIPNLGGRTEKKVQSDVFSMIVEKESEVLKKALGIVLFKDLNQYIGCDGLSFNAPQEYKELVYGKDYTLEHPITKQTVYRYWNGLLEKDTCDSLLADYVYYYYWRFSLQKTTLSGDVKNDSKVGNNVSMSAKLSDAWNRFIDQYQSGISYGCEYGRIISNRLHNGYGLDFYHKERFYTNKEISLLVYLEENKSDFRLPIESHVFQNTIENEFGL